MTANPWKIQLFELGYDDRESRAVAQVLESRWITMGERTREFEARFAAYLGESLPAEECGDATAVRATAVSSGTAALHMAILALGIGPGDEVIVPALTFVADLNVVRMAGAIPVLADCTSEKDWNISPADAARKITARTRAVLCVHYAGYPCDMDALAALCRDRGVALIEDASHAPGAAYRGRRCGVFGDIACFSFFTNKNLSVGEGGMFVTRSEALDRRARHLRSHGMTSLTLDRHQGRAVTYDVLEPGLNYRMDEMRAALGLVQLEKLPAGNARRGDLTRRYHGRLAGIRGLTLPFGAAVEGNADVLPSFHILPVLLEDAERRLAVIARLREEGIQSSIHYPSMRGFTACRGLALGETPLADRISLGELTLPLFPGLSLEAVDTVTGALRRALDA